MREDEDGGFLQEACRVSTCRSATVREAEEEAGAKVVAAVVLGLKSIVYAIAAYAAEAATLSSGGCNPK